MDEAALRRRLDAVTPEPSRLALDAAWLRLSERMTTAEVLPSAPRRSASPTRRVAVGWLGITASAVTASVLLAGTGPAPSASAQVARALRHAADALSTRSVAVSGYRQHFIRRVTLWDVTKHGAASLGSSYLFEGVLTLRRTTRPEVWERTWSHLHTLEAWGPEKGEVLRRAAAEEASAAPTTERSDTSANFWNGPDTVSPRQIADVPRDPGALIQYLKGATGADDAGLEEAGRAMNRATALLGSGLADARLQGDVYRALERLPGLTIDSHATDVDGRPGVAIGLVTSKGQQRTDILIDQTSGRYLGYRQIDLVPTAGAPVGTLQEGTAVYPR